MDRLNRRVVAAFAALALVGVALVVFGGAVDDDAEDGNGDGGSTAASVTTTSAPDPDDCGIEVPEVPGTVAVPACPLGFGVAVPEGWDATRLDPDALERLSNVDLSRPSFLPAARRAAAAGAELYAAGVEAQGPVSDLKVDVEDGVDTSADAIRAEARALVDGGTLAEATLVDDDGPVRVDYRLTLPDAETGDELDVAGSRLFVPDGDRLWSLIVTSEDPATRSELVDLFASTITFD